LGFHFETAGVYPVRHLQADKEQVSQDGYFRNHFFDEKKKETRKPKYGAVTHDLRPLKGVQPIR
jgi:hypothetical protein